MAESTPTTDTPQAANQDPAADEAGETAVTDDESIEERLARVEAAIAALSSEPEAELPDARSFKVSQEMLDRLDNTFVYHGAGPDQAKRYEFIRARARAFAQVIVTLTPPSREQSLAITALEEAVMRANQAIAVNE